MARPRKAQKRAAKKAPNRRGAPDAIAKRRASRALNQLFESGGTGPGLDGRTLKRKKRLLDELKEGRDGQPLKAVELLKHASDLLELGETLTSLRKLKPKLPSAPTLDADAASVIATAQTAYAFDERAWKLLGVNLDKLAAPPPKRERGGARKKKTRSRKSA
ncbi:MAG: hypothetical protein KC619_30950 [Myxococcales bacterium]|nr:hypothetical protein [Myxococcales bacterium]